MLKRRRWQIVPRSWCSVRKSLLAATKITKNRRFWPPYSRLRPFSTEPPRRSARASYRPKVESLGYFFVADIVWVYLLGKFSWWVQKNALFVQLSGGTAIEDHLRSLILVPIERALWDLLYSSPWPYRKPFLRCGDVLVQIRQFFPPLSHSAPSVVVTPFEFLRKLYRSRNQNPWGADSKNSVILFASFW